MKLKIRSGRNYLSAFVHKSTIVTSNKLALLLSGYLDSKDYLHLVELGHDLAKLGFTSVRFDPTGVWQSEGAIKFYTVTQYLKDVDRVIDFMRRWNKKAFSKTIILGHSLGGMIAILYSIKNKKIDGLVGIMPPASQTLPKGFQEKLKEWQKNKVAISYRVLPNNRRKEKKFTVPYSYIEDSKKYNVLKVISRFKKPILLLAGEKDDKISPVEVEKIYKKANNPKEFMVLKGIDHDYRLDKKKIKIVNDSIINFFKKFNFC